LNESVVTMGQDRRNERVEMSVATVEFAVAGGANARSDRDLISELRAGRNAAFGELTIRHRSRVEMLCRRFFSDRETIRDLTQESFMRAFAGLGGYDDALPFSAWLRTIVINICFDELRRRRRRPEELVADFTVLEGGWAATVNRASPEELVDLAEQRREAFSLAHRLLGMLRPDDRMVLTLKESEGMSVREIAEAMGWSTAKVKVRAFRARRALRREAERVLRAGGWRPAQ
jgi:RNA polymerase sigma factor (sigma-70 family)